MSTLLRRQFTAFLLIVTLFVTMIGVVKAAPVAPPNIVSYQGRVLNSAGVPVTDGSLSVVFKLYTVDSGGSAIWTESKSVSLSSGLFSVNLGDTTPILDSVFSDNNAVYLGVTIGADSEMTPRKRMTAAPYALNAQTLDGIDSASFFQTTGTLAVTNGGTGSTTASGARTNLGLAIGTDVLAPTGNGSGLTSLTAANISAGTAGISISGNAATVTTNANLTGPITSVGNATSVASQTGTGSTFVMQTSPDISTSLTTGSASFDLLNTTAATVNFAGAATTLNLGSTSVARSINIGTGGLADTINVGTGGGTDLIHIGDDATAKTITIGNAAATSVSITDNNWNISTTGTANFASIGATTTGTGKFSAITLSQGGDFGDTDITTSPGEVLIVQAATPLASNTTGPIVAVYAGNGTGINNGGELQLQGGLSGAGITGNGGAISIVGGSSEATNGNGGATRVYGGLGAGSGTGGNVTISGGGASGALGSTAGNVYVDAGAHEDINPGKVYIGGTYANQVSIGTTGSIFPNSIFVGHDGTNTITIGGVGVDNATDTISIATNSTSADTLTIGNSNPSTTVSLTGGNDWNITNTGLITTADDLALNGGDITTTSGTFNVANAATTLDLGSTNIARAINIGTGSSADTINIGTGGGTDLIHIGDDATAKTIAIGNAAATSVSITDDNWSVSTAGVAAFKTTTVTQAAVGTVPLTITGIASGTANQFSISTQNTSGNLMNASYPSATSLTGDLIGLNLDLTTNVTNVAQNATGVQVYTPQATGLTVGKTINGIRVGGETSPVNGAITSLSGMSSWSGVSVISPAITQTGGTLFATDFFAKLTPANITTGGSLYGVSVFPSGATTGVGSVYGVNVGDISDASATTTAAYLIGSGWDNAISGTTAGTNLISFTNFGVTTAGLITTADDLALNGGDLTTTQTTATLFNTTATTLSLGGAATTALNLGNGSGAYSAINLGSGIGTHTINIAGTGATGVDTINIGTGGTGTDSVSIGSAAAANVYIQGGVVQLGQNGGVATGIVIGNSDPSTTTAITGGDDWAITTGGNIQMGAFLESTLATANLFDDAFTGDIRIDIGGVDTDTANTINIATNGTTAADTISIGNTNTSTAVSLDGGTLNIGSTNVTRAINIGTNTPASLTNSAIIIGGSAFTTNTITVGASDWKVVSGIGTFGGLGASSSSFSLLTTTATTIDFGSAATTLNMQTASTGSFTTNIGNFAGGASGDQATTLNVGGRGIDTIAIGSTSAFSADAITIGNTNASTTVGLSGSTTLTQSSVSVVPLTLTGLASGTANEFFINTKNISGDLIKTAYTSAVTPTAAGTLNGVDLDLRTLLTINNSTVNGMTVSFPDAMTFDGSDKVNGFSIETPGTITTTASTFNSWNGASIKLPALTDSGGVSFAASGFGVLIPSALLTSGIYNGLNVTSIGIESGAGTINGINIGNTSGTTGTTTVGIAIGSGWDNQINGIGWSVTGVGTTSVNIANTTTNGHALCQTTDGTGHTSEIKDCDAGGTIADYAERYPVAEGITYGDIVVPGTQEVITQTGNHIVQLVKSSIAYQGPVSGIVSDNYNDFTSAGKDLNDSDNPMPVALAGRVPVNVTNENGPIHVGDFVTTSSTVGKGMKATLAGRIIGMALADFDGVSGQVMIQVNNSWYFGNLLGNDGTSTLLTSDVIVAPVSNATVTTQTFDSYGLALRGSAWDGNQAQTVSMMFKNTVTDGSNYRLSVRNTTGSEVAYITNTGTMQVAGDMVVGGKIYPSNLGGIQKDKYIYYDGSSGPGGDFMRTNASGWSTGSYDFAEMFPSTQDLVSGDVVVFSEKEVNVKRSSKKNEKSIAGIVSTRPGFLAGENTPGSFPIALAGRVPTNVNTENGAIAVGDPLTTSSTEGFAMKATKAGPIVGYALEPLAESQGKIIVFVSAGFWGGDATSSTPGADNRASLFGSSGDSMMTSLSMNGNINMSGNEISNIGRMNGLADAWIIEQDGTIKTESLLKTIITGQNNQKVETVAVTSPETVITLSGTSMIKDGQAEVRFEDVNKDFGNVISAIAPVRVVATPHGPVSLYVSEKDQNHFIVKSFGGNASEVEFDWVVTGYRKGYEPGVAPIVDTTTIVPAVTSTIADATAAGSGTPPIMGSVSVVDGQATPATTAAISDISTTGGQAPPYAEATGGGQDTAPTTTDSSPTVSVSTASDTSGTSPASSTSSSTTIVDSSVTNADASTSTPSP